MASHLTYYVILSNVLLLCIITEVHGQAEDGGIYRGAAAGNVYFTSRNYHAIILVVNIISKSSHHFMSNFLFWVRRL